MSRYSFSTVTTRADGKRVFKSTIYPRIYDDPSDIYIITNSSMYLDTLAFKYYKDESLWWIIALANNMGKGKLSVESGKQIKIPGNLSRILNDFKQLNSINT